MIKFILVNYLVEKTIKTANRAMIMPGAVRLAISMGLTPAIVAQAWHRPQLATSFVRVHQIL